MSKVLKFIVHFVVICTILCVVALAVPPFFGVTTEIRDSAGDGSNLPMGSVTYAVPVRSTEMSAGDTILAQKGEVVSRYNIISLDLENSMGTAVDPTAAEAVAEYISIGEYMPRTVVTIPLIGYLMVATESIEGLIILGLAVLFLIILYVIAELWKKDPEDEEIPEDTAPGYVKTKRELKQEEKRRERQLREEEREIRAEGKAGKKKEKRTVHTGGFVDEIDEDDLEDEEYEAPRPETRVQTATSEAHEVLKKEIAAATAEEAAPVRKKKQNRRDQTGNAGETKEEVSGTPEEPEEQPVEILRMAIPRMTAAQLAEKAQKAGDAPDIVKDDITKVTLLDYSDIFAEDDEDYEEE